MGKNPDFVDMVGASGNHVWYRNSTWHKMFGPENVRTHPAMNMRKKCGYAMQQPSCFGRSPGTTPELPTKSVHLFCLHVQPSGNSYIYIYIG